jgi:branched-chain amino acid transport system permease protein
VVLVLAGLIAAVVGILFGIPSPAHQGSLSGGGDAGRAVLHRWLFARVKWFTNYSSSGSVSTAPIECSAGKSRRRPRSTCSCSACWCFFTVVAKNLVRGHIGRAWMAMRDMDVAAEVIGIRPVYAKLTAFAVSSVLCRRGGALWGFVYLGAWEPLAFNLTLSLNLLFMIIIAAWVRCWGVISGRVHRRAADPARPGAGPGWGCECRPRGLAPRVHDLSAA